MNRRTFLAVGGSAALGAVVGCLGEESGTPANEFGYETATHEGTDVPLAPIDDVIGWYQDEEARFADARGSDQYREMHIAGAVLSPAPNGLDDDPVAEWPTDARIVTYCGCPHHLSVMRGASLIDDGYAHTYAIDEGFWEWQSRGYPISGENVQADHRSYEVRGVTDPDHAGEMVMLEQVGADRREPGRIAADGSYAITLHYAGSPADRFSVDAPGYTVEAPLNELTSGVVRA